LISTDEALKLVGQHSFLPIRQRVTLMDSVGAKLAEAVSAPFPIPQFDNSVLDGFAVGSAKGPWRATQTIGAGTVGQALGAGDAAKIFTGAKVPEGTFAVIAIEDIDLNGDFVSGIAVEGAYIRRKGEELEVGTVVLPSGTRITPASVSVLSAFDRTDAEIWTRPRIALLTTGTELISPGMPINDGQRYDSNGPMIESALIRMGCQVHREWVGDKVADTVEVCKRLLEDNDLLITIGGISAGDFDFVQTAITELNFAPIFKGVAMKPGKPVTFGVRGDKKAWFGLPGNPMSALVTFAIFVTSWMGEPPVWRKGTLTTDIDRKPGREEFIPACWQNEGIHAMPTIGSHSISGFVGATGLARIPREGETIKKGTVVDYWEFPGWIS
jgi:molybdopterin molybdotransferase